MEVIIWGRGMSHIFHDGIDGEKNMNYFYNKYAENRVQIRKRTVGWKHSMHSFEGCFLPFQ